VGTGAACGAKSLDEGFNNLLRNKLGRHSTELLAARHLPEILRHFENLKCEFDPYSEDCESEYHIPMVAARGDIPGIDLRDNYLRLDRKDPELIYANNLRAEIQRVFDPVFDKILRLNQEQLDLVKAKNQGSVKVCIPGEKYLISSDFVSRRGF